jgi:CRP-like cAMP-binding protein
MMIRAEGQREPQAAMASAQAAARPLAEVFACTVATERLLDQSAQTICFASGETIFRQGERSRGLYVVVNGCLARWAMQQGVRVELNCMREGELVELAAVLGDSVHTYTLTAKTDGVLLLLSAGALKRALEADAGLRMRLLEELAREVSRGYGACRMLWMARMRKYGDKPGF